VNKELTEIVVVLDESGSMGSIRNDTIGGFNTFLEDQKKLDSGKAKLTLVTFSSSVRTPINGRDVVEVEPLNEKTYRPNGGTALLDAIGVTIDSIETRYTNEEDENNIPAKVIFAIITDGEENASKTYNKESVAKMIRHQTKRHSWEFVFLGANLDAVKEASSLGISSNRSLNFSPSSGGFTDTIHVLNNATSTYRSRGIAEYDIRGTSLEAMNTHLNADTTGTLTVKGDIKIGNLTITNTDNI
jgi:uncharacterized protein YegL